MSHEKFCNSYDQIGVDLGHGIGAMGHTDKYLPLCRLRVPMLTTKWNKLSKNTASIDIHFYVCL